MRYPCFQVGSPAPSSTVPGNPVLHTSCASFRLRQAATLICC